MHKRRESPSVSGNDTGGGKSDLQVLSDKKVLLLYASGAVAAEGKMSEEHMTIKKGHLE